MAAVVIVGFAAAVVVHRGVPATPRAASRLPVVASPVHVGSIGPVPPPSAPTGLREQQVSAHRLIFSWTPVPGATNYRVRVGQHRYVANVPRMVIDHPFRPKTRHSWQVQGWRGKIPGPLSKNAVFTVELLPSRVWSFPLVRIHSGTWLLTLSNPNAYMARATVSIRGGSRASAISVQIPAHSSTGVRAPIPQSRAFTVVAKSDGPIVGRRMRIGTHPSQPVYGIPGS